MKTPISYYGGKARIASKIVSVLESIPHTVYSEPFCGGLAVLFCKPLRHGNKDRYREAINDTNKCLITFYRVARERPDELERILYLTPYSQEEHRVARQIYKNPLGYDDLQIAWSVFVLCNMSFSNKIGGGWGYGQIGRNLAYTWHNRKRRLPECFERLSEVHIGCEDALDFIKRWDSPHTLFYLDPPYPGADMGHYKGYSLSDYESLCNLLDDCEASYVLSNYHQDIKPISAQKTIEIDAVMSAAKNKRGKRTEVLWVCDRSDGARSDLKKILTRHRQLSLFA